MLKTISILLAAFAIQASAAHAAPLCDDPLRSQDVCYKMNHLRAQIHVLDAQRELMQVNPEFYLAAGKSLANTSKIILERLGPGIPEHHQGLAGVAQLGQAIAKDASRANGSMVVSANMVRAKCATCHATANPAGGVKWDDIFKSDWTQISARCSEYGRNPYLCKSMNGMLSAYGYLLTAYNSDIQDFEMAKQAANEVIRILEDLKAKNFSHLPENLRLEALGAARDVSEMAARKDPSTFEKSLGVANACMQCHQNSQKNSAPALHFAGMDRAPIQRWIAR